MSAETFIPEEYKPAADAKGDLSTRFGLDKGKLWSADQGLSYNEMVKEHAINYDKKAGGANEVGQIDTGMATHNVEGVGLQGENTKEKKSRQLLEIIQKGMDAFYEGMKDWSSDDFHDFNKAFVNKLREKAREAYDAGDYALYATLSEAADDYLQDAAAIWNDPDLTEEEKQEANEELIQDQDQTVVQEVIYKSDYESPTPEVQAAVKEYGRLHMEIDKNSGPSDGPPVLGSLPGLN